MKILLLKPLKTPLMTSKNTVREEEKKMYCTECGEEMFSFLCEAGNVRIWRYDSGGGTTYRLASPFNKNGEKNYAEAYQCPQYKRRFLLGGNHHDIWCFFEGEKYYPDNL